MAGYNFPVVKGPCSTQPRPKKERSETAKCSIETPKISDQKNASQGLDSAKSKSSEVVTPSLSHPMSNFSAKELQVLVASYQASFRTSLHAHINSTKPPSSKILSRDLLQCNLPPILYQDAYYSNDLDVPENPREYAGREFKLGSISVPYLPAFNLDAKAIMVNSDNTPPLLDQNKEKASFRYLRERCRLRNWEFSKLPPDWQEVNDWLHKPKEIKRTQQTPIPNKSIVRSTWAKPAKRLFQSQIDDSTPKNRHGYKYSQKRKSTSVRHETQYMSVMSLEIHVNTRQSLAPDPEHDEVGCIFWSVQENDGNRKPADEETVPLSGILLLANTGELATNLKREMGIEVEWWPNELDLINRMVDVVREYDPDILTGYEVHSGSWGYLMERARIRYEFDLCNEFSRMVAQSHGRFGKDTDRWGFNTTSSIKITGRHVINVWRAMRSELNLLQYTLENVAFHLLHKRVPHYTFQDLTDWFTNGGIREKARCVSYYRSRTSINLEILDANELVPRTSEQARLIGVDFFSVFSRGSQFKVESFMFRIAKPENFILVSPSRKQVGQQNALECLPLVMEPVSAFYNSPLLVLDFQSLYPSVMIAYNYCYSTCLGRVVDWRGQNKLGFADFKRQPGLMSVVKDSINISPNGMMYVKPEMRKSLLAKMLGEILETRLMVKSGMKVDKDDTVLQKLLNNRQLALKLLANVTYGYTSASFSGRMPAAEIADSIVQTGREILEKAIAYIHSVDRWGAEVVYGDTDSLFVYLKGRTRAQAFDIGEEIASAITKMNPQPIKLKFEKVYHPCVLLAKKRYVGFKYESRHQQTPDFDAKGIETVRRDGTPAEQKIEEQALRILFCSSDLSQVKSYFQRQCMKIMTGKVSIQDFCFAREVKLGTYAEKGPPPPGALISTRRMLQDPRTEPQYGERVPYVVITGAPGARLIDRCVAPEYLLKQNDAELDAEYYISKNLIPPLERIFNLVGANVRLWYDEMPKVQKMRDNSIPVDPSELQYTSNGMLVPIKHTLEGYMRTSHCVVCREKIKRSERSTDIPSPVCAGCLAEIPSSLYTLQMRKRENERQSQAIHNVCRSCAGLAPGDEVRCDSRDCPVFYGRVRWDQKERKVNVLVGAATDFIEEAAPPCSQEE